MHGITDADVADCPTFAQVARSLYTWLEGCDIAGFNSNRFDVPMLVEEFLRAGIAVDFDDRHFVDVQTIFHKMERRTLEAAYKFYCDKTLENAHSAEADTRLPSKSSKPSSTAIPMTSRTISPRWQNSLPTGVVWTSLGAWRTTTRTRSSSTSVSTRVSPSRRSSARLWILQLGHGRTVPARDEALVLPPLPRDT